MRLCILCRTNPATIPDRKRGGLKKEVCQWCHAERLRGDLGHILKVHRKRTERERSFQDETRRSNIHH